VGAAHPRQPGRAADLPVTARGSRGRSAGAERVCVEHGLELQLALVHDNLGFLHLRRGDVPSALRHYEESYRRHVAVGAPAITVLMDQSELLLSVHLVTEAREAAQRAVEQCDELNRQIYLPQTLLLLAEGGLLDDDVPAARDAAERALRVARRQQRAEWTALAQDTVLKCRTAEDPRRSRRASWRTSPPRSRRPV
jgi:hypothetical protein